MVTSPQRAQGILDPGVASAIALQFDGDAAMYQAFAATCATQFTLDAMAGEAACATGDVSGLCRLTHNLKSALNLLGRGAVSDLASLVEKQAAAGDLDSACASWRSLHAALLAMTEPVNTRVPSALNVLYVEDYALGATLLLDSFSRRAPDIQVEVVSTVTQAIERLNLFESNLANLGCGEAAQTPRYDVVLTDLNLPDGLGLDIVAHVRSHRLVLPVVILTGSIEDDTVIDALRAGAKGYVAKRGDYLARLPLALRAAVDRFRSEISRSYNSSGPPPPSSPHALAAADE